MYPDLQEMHDRARIIMVVAFERYGMSLSRPCRAGSQNPKAKGCYSHED